VIAENGHEGDRHVAADLREKRGLLRLAVSGEIAGEEDQVRVPLGLREGSRNSDAILLAAMDVAGGGDADAVHRIRLPREAGFANGAAGYSLMP
jgi:hypothetical protein